MYLMLSYKRSALVASTLLHPLPTFKPAKCGTVCKNDDLWLDTFTGIGCLVVISRDIAAESRDFCEKSY